MSSSLRRTCSSPIPEPLLSELFLGWQLFLIEHVMPFPLSEKAMSMKLSSDGDMPCLNAFSINDMKMSGAICFRLSGDVLNSVESFTFGESLIFISEI